MPLAKLEQDDWAAGMFRGVARHLIPPNGFYDGKNCLIDDDGLVRERGGVTNLSTSGPAAALTFAWAGYLGPGERIVFATVSNFYVLDGALAPVTLAGGGLTEPKRAVEVGGLLLIGGGTIYGGSLKAADYSSGTVAVTNGSKIVTKAAGGFTANVDAGMLLRIGAAGRYYVVASRDSDTQLTLRDAYQGATNAAAAFVLSRLGTMANAGGQVSDFYAHAADRALAGIGSRIFFSDVTVADPGQATSGQGASVWAATDYHELPEGANVLGVWDVGTLAIVFSTKGIFTIRNLAYDLTDATGNPQQQLDHAAPEIVLWGNAGIASYRSALVVPALEGIYLFDGISSPVPLAGSIAGLYRGYIAAGHKPGLAAVYRGHYFLPVLTSGGQFVDLLVCRLDRPVRARGQDIFPWTRLAGFGAQVAAFAARVVTPVPTPQLIGATLSTTGRLLDCTSYFAAAAAVKNDVDGTTPIWELVTRDFTLGPVPTQTKKLRIDYELDDAASDNPTITAGYNVGEPTPTGSAWGVAHWGSDPWTDSDAGDFIAIAGAAPADPEGDTPYEGFYPNVRAKRVRFRLSNVVPNATLRFRALELFIRPNRKT